MDLRVSENIDQIEPSRMYMLIINIMLKIGLFVYLIAILHHTQ